MQRPPANWPTRYWPWSSTEDKTRTFPSAIIAEPFKGAAPPFGSKDEDSDDSEETEETEASLTITAEPFPGAAPPFGSKDEDDSDDDDSEETEASLLTWGTFALDALPDSLTDEPGEHDDAVDHSKDGEARDTSTGGFAAAARLVAEQGITSPVSKLPPAQPGAAEKAKERSKMGRGIEGGGDEGIDPMSTMDKFNWDNLPLPGLGQV
jgi:hypothetical protein